MCIAIDFAERSFEGGLNVSSSGNLSCSDSPPLMDANVEIIKADLFVAKKPETMKADATKKTEVISETKSNSMSFKSTQLDPCKEHNSNQVTINSFLLEEIAKLRDQQSKLCEDIISLRNSNSQLVTTLEKYTSMDPNYKPPELKKAMVMFDLTKTPAVVLTANDSFCQILGYQMNEVIGAPWQKFIHPDYLKRTLDILTKTSPNDPTCMFEQMYKHKAGPMFAGCDTHTIFFAAGNPVSDLVSIVLEQPKLGATKESQQLQFAEKSKRETASSFDFQLLWTKQGGSFGKFENELLSPSSGATLQSPSDDDELLISSSNDLCELPDVDTLLNGFGSF